MKTLAKGNPSIWAVEAGTEQGVAFYLTNPDATLEDADARNLALSEAYFLAAILTSVLASIKASGPRKRKPSQRGHLMAKTYHLVLMDNGPDSGNPFSVHTASSDIMLVRLTSAVVELDSSATVTVERYPSVDSAKSHYQNVHWIDLTPENRSEYDLQGMSRVLAVGIKKF